MYSDGVEFGGVGRQTLNPQTSAGAGDVILHQTTPVNGGSIPQDQQLTGDMALQVSEKLDDLRAFHRPRVELEVEPKQGQTANQGKTLPVEGLLQKRRLAPRGPGSGPCGPGAQATFVDKHDQSALATRFFFIAGHSTRFHRWMATSSRSIARRSGRWQLNPKAPSTRQTCPG